jgi:hypothetical protein
VALNAETALKFDKQGVSCLAVGPLPEPHTYRLYASAGSKVIKAWDIKTALVSLEISVNFLQIHNFICFRLNENPLSEESAF